MHLLIQIFHFQESQASRCAILTKRKSLRPRLRSSCNTVSDKKCLYTTNGKARCTYHREVVKAEDDVILSKCSKNSSKIPQNKPKKWMHLSTQYANIRGILGNKNTLLKGIAVVYNRYNRFAFFWMSDHLCRVVLFSLFHSRWKVYVSAPLLEHFTHLIGLVCVPTSTPLFGH